MAFVLEVPPNLLGRQQRHISFSTSIRPSNFVTFSWKNQSCRFSISSTLNTRVQSVGEKHLARVNDVANPIMVNSCMGKMGQAIIEAGLSAGLDIVPVPNAVNENAELYCKIGVPFVMGTTGGDRDLLYKTVQDSNLYAVISPQMGKQVVAFLAAMEIMSNQFPGAFTGYTLEVLESHQHTKLDTSGTAKAVISCFQKLGVSFDVDQVQLIRDPKQQVEMVGVPEKYLDGHAFHMYHLTSPDGTVSFEFQHNVCGRSIYAEGAIDAALFLAKKIQSKADKKIYDMIDVLREGSMR